MPKGSEELTNARKEEIINACEQLYNIMSFKDITIKKIGGATSFTRTSIYNYFKTKEEIFLALLQREYELWVADLNEMQKRYATLCCEAFFDGFARLLEKRTLLLKLLSMNHYDMESNSRPERLKEFKAAYGKALQTVKLCLDQYFPDMSEADKRGFIYTFFPFMFGIYPYTAITDKQRAAMDEAGVKHPRMSVYDITYNCVKKLIQNKSEPNQAESER